MREVSENCESGVRDSVPPLAPAAVGVLVRLEPPEDLHDGRLGIGVAISSAAACGSADRTGGARAGHRLHRDGGLHDGDRIHRRGLHGNLGRRRRRHGRHVRDGVRIGSVDGNLDFLHRRRLDVVRRDLLLFLQFLGLVLDLGDVGNNDVLLLPGDHSHDAEDNAEHDRNDNCRERSGKALQLNPRKLVFAGVVRLPETLEHVAKAPEEALYLVFLGDLVKVNDLSGLRDFLYDFFFAHGFFLPLWCAIKA